MINEEIKPYMYNQNPWWIKSDFLIEESALPRREIFDDIIKQTLTRQIIAINGLRRTGKTTILKQLTAQLLQNKKVHARDVFFFSFDQDLIERKSDILEQIIIVYLEQVLAKKIWELDHRVYILLDEIQFVPHWQTIIKRFYDQTQMIKFYVSGSASLFVKEKSKESLAGRIFTYTLPVLSFREYLVIKKIDLVLPKADLVTGDFDLKKINETLASFSTKICGLFEDYLLKGQFPEVIMQDMKQTQIRQYLIDSILGKILEFDIPIYFNIKRVDEIKTIFKVVATETGNLVEYETIARDLGMSRNTVAEYFSCLEKAFLINIIFNYTKSIRKGLRTAKKAYATSTNFSALLSNVSPANMQYNQMIGHYVETHVGNILYNKHQNIDFVRRRKKELDFLIKDARQFIPIEVKYSSRIQQKDIGNLIYFMQQSKYRRGYVLTKNRAGIEQIKGKKIIFLPVWVV